MNYSDINRNFDSVAILDGNDSPVDVYFRSMGIDHLDISKKYGRTADFFINLKLIDRFLNGYAGNVLVLITLFNSRIPIEELNQIASKNCWFLVITNENTTAQLKNGFIQRTPVNISCEDFSFKVGAHLKRMLGSESCRSFFPKKINFPKSIFNFSSLKDVATCQSKIGVGRLLREGREFDFFFNLKEKTKKLIVIGQSALDRKNVDLPFFHRWRWTNDIEASSLVINDPTLYVSDRLNVGWWVGCSNSNYLELFVEELYGLLDSMGLSCSDLIFYGGSAGGFTSFQMALEMPGSKVVADIPQTNILDFHIRRDIENLLEDAFSLNANNFNHDFIGRFDVVEKIKRKKFVPDFIYLQNINDAFHNKRHLLYFVNSLEKLGFPYKGRYYFYDIWHPQRGGHTPLNRHATTTILNAAFEAEYSEKFIDLGLTEANFQK
ncbi:hypothetical protein [Comamonas testosteroni]|uniref:hypothetical protein n=1 Tax=Comamonas testosteroni TaxID=285 RepID=UPI002E0F2BAA|nr:hypothetical protein U0024_15220 [Comamonas testosteroni]